MIPVCTVAPQRLRVHCVLSSHDIYRISFHIPFNHRTHTTPTRPARPILLPNATNFA
mgnify:CR=1 FL=1